MIWFLILSLLGATLCVAIMITEKKYNGWWLWLMFLFLLVAGASYFTAKEQKRSADNLRTITHGYDISDATKIIIPLGLATKIDMQHLINATCDSKQCVYAGTYYFASEFYIELLSQPKINLVCSVENNCRLTSFVEHGVKYLKIMMDYK